MVAALVGASRDAAVVARIPDVALALALAADALPAALVGAFAVLAVDAGVPLRVAVALAVVHAHAVSVAVVHTVLNAAARALEPRVALANSVQTLSMVAAALGASQNLASFPLALETEAFAVAADATGVAVVGALLGGTVRSDVARVALALQVNGAHAVARTFLGTGL
jgi:hypothetical protein